MRETVFYSAWLLFGQVIKKTYVWFTGSVLGLAGIYETFIKDELPEPLRFDVPMSEWFFSVIAVFTVWATVRVYHEQRLEKLTLSKEVSDSGIAELKSKLPRELTVDQQSTIELGLRQHDEHKEMPIQIYTTDTVKDGVGYAADIASVFKTAGWYAFRATNQNEDRDYESGLWLIGGGSGNPLTIDVLERVFAEADVKFQISRTKDQTVEMIIGKKV